jgi:phage-related protein
MKPLEFLGSGRDDLRAIPDAIRHSIGLELMRVQFGAEPSSFKPMPTVGTGACEIRVRDVSGAYRAIYVAKVEAAVFALHAFDKKTQQTTKMDVELAKARYRLIGGTS